MSRIAHRALRSAAERAFRLVRGGGRSAATVDFEGMLTVVLDGAPEEPSVYERIQQGVAHPRVQGPQILDLRSRQMQAGASAYSARINCSQSAIVVSPVSPMARPFMRSDASSPDNRGGWVSPASSDSTATTFGVLFTCAHVSAAARGSTGQIERWT